MNCDFAKELRIRNSLCRLNLHIFLFVKYANTKAADIVNDCDYCWTMNCERFVENDADRELFHVVHALS